MQLNGEYGLESMAETYQHNMEGKCMPVIGKCIFLSRDEILYIVDEDSRRNDSTGMSLAFQPLY